MGTVFTRAAAVATTAEVTPVALAHSGVALTQRDGLAVCSDIKAICALRFCCSLCEDCVHGWC